MSEFDGKNRPAPQVLHNVPAESAEIPGLRPASLAELLARTAPLSPETNFGLPAEQREKLALANLGQAVENFVKGGDPSTQNLTGKLLSPLDVVEQRDQRALYAPKEFSPDDYPTLAKPALNVTRTLELIAPEASAPLKNIDVKIGPSGDGMFNADGVVVSVDLSKLFRP